MTNSVVRPQVMVTGRVQMVNYRQRVALEAQRRGLAGTVANDPKDRRKVLVEVQGGCDAIDAFLKAIRTPAGDSLPQQVKVTRECLPDPSLTDFEILYGDSSKEVVERINFAGEALTSLGEKVESGFSRVGSGLQGLEVRTGAVERAVEAGNDRAASFHDGLAEAVFLMDKKYGLIGQSLGRIEKALERQTRATDRQTEALIRLAREMTRNRASRGSTRKRLPRANR